MNKSLLILGAGGHGCVVKEVVEAMCMFDKADFLDDNPNSDVAIGLCSDYKKYLNEYLHAFPAIGNNEIRMRWLNWLSKAGFYIPRLIHPTAYVSQSATIGKGSIVGAKAVVNTNAKVEKGCIIGIGTLIDHDCFIGEGCHINTGAIIKANCCVEKLSKIDSGVVYSSFSSNEKTKSG